MNERTNPMRCVQSKRTTRRYLFSPMWVTARSRPTDFAERDLSEQDIAYLFVDGTAERIRPGQSREPVLGAWASQQAAPRFFCT